MLGELV